ncbi:hypothetical protein ACEPAH_7176 [Sanghuangporus vaninii]
MISRISHYGRARSALHLSVIVLATLVGLSHAHSPKRPIHVARQASLTIPTVTFTDSTSGSASVSGSGSVSILPISTTTTELTTSIGPLAKLGHLLFELPSYGIGSFFSSGTSTFLTTVTTLVGPGPSNASTISESNVSASATSTSTAFPSLSSYSACVDNCLQVAVSASNCSSVTNTTCYCASSIFPSALVQCASDQCSDELSTAEGLAHAFCNLSSSTVSLAFPAPSFSASSSASLSSATSASASVSASATGNAGTSLRLGLSQDVIWGSRIGLLSLVGIIASVSLLC